MNLSLLITALIAVESGGDCSAKGDNGRAVGCLQIHPGVVSDVNRVYEYNRYTLLDRKEEAASRQMATIYLVYYLAKLRKNHGENSSYEAAARIWNGGYHGYIKNRGATDEYWKKVKIELEKIGVSFPKKVSANLPKV